MRLKNRLYRIESDMRLAGDTSLVRLIIPWHESEPMSIMVRPSVLESLDKIYGASDGHEVKRP